MDDVKEANKVRVRDLRRISQEIARKQEEEKKDSESKEPEETNNESYE